MHKCVLVHFYYSSKRRFLLVRFLPSRTSNTITLRAVISIRPGPMPHSFLSLHLVNVVVPLTRLPSLQPSQNVDPAPGQVPFSQPRNIRRYVP